jgi:hypothetical protein
MCMITFGILAIAVRRHVSCPLSGRRRTHELLQITVGIDCGRAPPVAGPATIVTGVPMGFEVP